MAIIEVSTIVKQNKNKVYNILKNMEEFPKFMQDIKKLKVLERDANRLVTVWEVNIEGALVSWKEEDIFDNDAMSINFNMLEGDYSAYGGKWILTSLPKKTKISLLVNIDWGIPSFEKIINPILERKQKLIFKTMLIAIKNHIQKGDLNG